MKNLKLVVALLISCVLGGKLWILHEQNHTLVRQLNEQTNQLSHTQTELKQIQIRLAVAERELGFLDKYKTKVQVTAYTGASASSKFSDGGSVSHVYAVSQRTLPEDRIVSVALSPTAQSHLHARLHDYIVLIHKRRRVIAHFVDTMPNESRPVVDVYFADSRQAIQWGRKTDYYAVNLSTANSPFGVLR
jgi:hypothetical protein